MRTFMLAASVLLGGSIVIVGPARAETEYPFCSGDGFGMARDCSYATLAQCQEAVRGVGTACEPNPRFVAPPAEPVPAPAPPSPTPRR
ncbi:DUF3551 domain-containing protein [Bradyrhizobium sp. LHD-71]|uniref:DUF3551 domain-containing protein n=1 Tax=Bradyrhizobium sp. LHD-71 TaxID=3072141 RepID=UPI00280C7D31|nr:DUF3551 domain-containing protein [Bradyrhizobium sp. LHD-71]MDQ8730125.1 DUF3551 domain-containing protein [Bradyrhizobium sp. LHD-71]